MDIKEFLEEWNNPSDKLLVHTSGSTGKPKPMWVEKRRMAHSARTTCAFLGLQPGDTALLCMSLDYIAGKMMAVRAIEWGLKLVCVEPSGHPMGFKVDKLTSRQVDKLTSRQVNKLTSRQVDELTSRQVDELTSRQVDKLNETEANDSSTCQLVNLSTNSINSSTEIIFAAMTPMQVYNTLQVPEERERLMQVKHLLIGGGAIDDSLERELQSFPNAVWSTYGMTETLSHIALRRINATFPNLPQGEESHPSSLIPHPSSSLPSFGGDGGGFYTPFPDVSVSLNADGCLVIDAPGVCAETLVTNDCAELHPDGRRFRIIGRKDNVINSGGIKIQAEEVEQMLRPHLHIPYIITKDTDSKFGEIVVLVFQDTKSISEVKELCRAVLPKYWQPRRYMPVEHIEVTETGKPRRDINLYFS